MQKNIYISQLWNRYAYASAQMAEQEALHPDVHVFFNHGAVQNEPT